jgi:hypothetical protein
MMIRGKEEEIIPRILSMAHLLYILLYFVGKVYEA